LHAKVRVEILIGRAALYKSTYYTCPGEAREEREEEAGRASGSAERNNSLCSGIQCGSSETMADERKWQNNLQKWNSVGGRRPVGVRIT